MKKITFITIILTMIIVTSSFALALGNPNDVDVASKKSIPEKNGSDNSQAKDLVHNEIEVQKRVIDTNNLKQIRNEYKKSVDNYKELTQNLTNNKKSLTEAIKNEKNCKENCAELEKETISLLQQNLHIISNMMQENINKIQNKVMANNHIEEDVVNNFNLSNTEKLNQLDSFKEKINSIKTKEESKNLWKEMSNYWNQNKNKLQEQVSLVQKVEVNSVLVRMETLQNKLNNIQDQLSGEEISQFSSLIEDAKNLHNKEMYKESNQKLKEANVMLIKEILPRLRENLTQPEIESFLKIN